jgi:hypothetical protein
MLTIVSTDFDVRHETSQILLVFRNELIACVYSTCVLVELTFNSMTLGRALISNLTLGREQMCLDCGLSAPTVVGSRK